MKVSIFDTVISADRSNYAYLSSKESIHEYWYISDQNVINKHLSTLLKVGKTSLEENYHDRIDF